MGASGLPSADDDEGGIVAEINITPLTDIFLVLLIIFMVTTTAAHDESKNIDLPTAQESEEQPPEPVTVEVDDDGSLLINGEPVPAGQMRAMLEAAIAEADEKIVLLRGDKRVLLGQAVEILDTAQQVGAKGIALATQPPAPGS